MLSVRFMGICNLRETERFQSAVIITPPATLSVWPHTLLQCQPESLGHMRLYFCASAFLGGCLWIVFLLDFGGHLGQIFRSRSIAL